MRDRVADRSEPTHRMAYQQWPLESQLLDEPGDVAHLTVVAVVRSRLPLAVTVTALIERKAVVLPPQHQADHVPRMRVQAAAMQKQNRTAPRDAPIQVMKPHPVNHDMV